MASLNRIELIGRLGADPVLKHTPSGREVATFSIAINRRWTGSDGTKAEATDWFNVEVWGNLARACHQYLAKGREVYLSGRVQTDMYETDGVRKYFTKVIGREVQFLGSAPVREPEGPERDAVMAVDEDYLPF